MAVQPVIMPKLGVYTEDVLLTEWLVEEGAPVEVGDLLFALETDKTTAEVEAEAAGWLHHLVAAGEKVPIGECVGVIAPTQAAYDSLGGIDGGGPPKPTIERSGEVGDRPLGAAAGRVDAGSRRVAGEEGAGSPLVSPRARALLRRLGFSLQDAAEITGSGAGGRIVDRDVAVWAEARSVGPQRLQPATSGDLTVARTIPLRGRRGTIAARMVASLQTTAQLTSVLELDVKPLVELRETLNKAGAGPRVGVTSILVKLVAAALREHPILNARVTSTEIELLAEINIAVAVDTEEGIVAPVVRGANHVSLEETNVRIVDLARRARANSLTPADVDGGTFTVSNGGIYPVDLTTAILNPPQTGILWVGRIRERPVVVSGGAIEARPTMQACLTYDHRAVDGGPAAAFLATLESLLADLPRLPA